MADIVLAPWDNETLSLLQEYQFGEVFHEYTCGEGHKGNHGQVLLIPLSAGWFCHVCDEYTQNWCYTSTLDMMRALRKATEE